MHECLYQQGKQGLQRETGLHQLLDTSHYCGITGKYFALRWHYVRDERVTSTLLLQESKACIIKVISSNLQNFTSMNTYNSFNPSFRRSHTTNQSPLIYSTLLRKDLIMYDYFWSAQESPHEVIMTTVILYICLCTPQFEINWRQVTQWIIILRACEFTVCSCSGVFSYPV